MDKRDGECSSAVGVSLNMADPPLLVLFPIHHNHLSLVEGQLIGVIGLAVVDGFHSPGLMFRVDTPGFGGGGR